MRKQPSGWGKGRSGRSGILGDTVSVYYDDVIPPRRRRPRLLARSEEAARRAPWEGNVLATPQADDRAQAVIAAYESGFVSPS
jgi:hypothetical protein